jgi:hypothetical protein
MRLALSAPVITPTKHCVALKGALAAPILSSL